MAINGAERRIMNKEEIGAILAVFKGRLSSENIPFKNVYLFGSYAEGGADKDSDIDVAVVLPSGISQELRGKLDVISLWAKEIHVKLEIHLLSTADLADPYLSLPAYVKRFGLAV